METIIKQAIDHNIASVKFPKFDSDKPDSTKYIPKQVDYDAHRLYKIIRSIKKDNQMIDDIQGVPFNLRDLLGFKLTVPWEGWDGNATISVTVTKGNDQLSQVYLQDRNATLKVIGNKNAQTKDITKVNTYLICSQSCNSSGNCRMDCNDAHGECDIDLQLNIDAKTGHISIRKADMINCDNAKNN